MSKKIGIVGNDFFSVYVYLLMEDCRDKNYFHVTSPDHIRGLRGADYELMFIGNWMALPNIKEIIEVDCINRGK